MKDKDYENFEGFEDYVSDEDKKSKIFAIGIVIFLVVAIGLIVGFSLANRTTDEEAENGSNISVSDSTEEAGETEKSTVENESEKEYQAKTTVKSSNSTIDKNDSDEFMKKLDEENSRYEKEVQEINNRYDASVAENEKMIEQISNLGYDEKIEEYEMQIEIIDAMMEDMNKNDPSYEKLVTQRDVISKSIELQKTHRDTECTPYKYKISELEKQRKTELDEAKKTHEKNLQNISDKYK